MTEHTTKKVAFFKRILHHHLEKHVYPRDEMEKNTNIKEDSSAVRVVSGGITIKPDYSVREIELCSTPQFDPTVYEEPDGESIGQQRPFSYDLNVMNKISKDDLPYGFDLNSYLDIPEISHPIKVKPAARLSGFHKERLSPINLDNVAVSVKFQSLQFQGYTFPPTTMIVHENKVALKITGEFKGLDHPSISGGPLHHKYIFDHLSFHWGMENSQGSEHTYFGYSFPMEVHVIHRREDLKFEDALKTLDGIVVVAYFVLLSDDDNLVLNNILEKSADLKASRTSHIKPFKLGELVPQFEMDYFCYNGCLTTNPHSDCVTWIISTLGITISQKQLEEFRDLARGCMEHNIARTVSLNGRTLFFCTDM